MTGRRRVEHDVVVDAGLTGTALARQRWIAWNGIESRFIALHHSSAFIDYACDYPAGAVLKVSVEIRFGLVPTFHKAPLAHFPSPAWVAYLEEKTSSRHHSNNIHQQLDLLYEFCQWALARFPLPAPQMQGPHVRLWRGSNRVEEQLLQGTLRERRCRVRLNNIVSFSLSPEEASCFGDWVFELLVPRSKLLVFPGLLPGQVLQGEQEVIALGGDYDVVARYD